MGEFFEAGESEPEASPAVQTDGTAVAIALDRARRRKGKAAGPDEVDRFLEKQEVLIDKQVRHLDEQLHQMRLKHVSERLKVGAQFLTIGLGVAAVAVLVGLAWQASRASGIVVKPFSTPPAMAERGVTGEALAGRLMDQLARISEISRSGEQQRDIAADGDHALSLEIPETGISLGQVDQWLRAKLGHEQPLSGELSVNGEGRLVLEARLARRPLPLQTGADADLDAMVQKTAEAIYASEQPTSWALYLTRQNRWAELLDFGRGRAAAADPRIRAAGYLNMGDALRSLQGDEPAVAAWEKSVRLWPTGALYDLAGVDTNGGRDERALRLRRDGLRALADRADLTPAGRIANESEWLGDVAGMVGDLPEALARYRVFSRTGNPGGGAGANYGAGSVAMTLARLHDLRGAREAIADLDERSLAISGQKVLWWIAQTSEDWPAALAAAQAGLGEEDRLPDKGVLRVRWKSNAARALVQLGRTTEADAVLAQTALDCVPCLRARGLGAEARGDRRSADHWFAEAVRLSPSIAFANEDWGRMLLRRGDAKAALARFEAARAQSPHYPDAIEGRGEALLALGDARQAAKAFADAAKLAPKWGRLHLKWGQALARLGKADEAKAQFTAAAALDLTAAETAELAKARGHG